LVKKLLFLALVCSISFASDDLHSKIESLITKSVYEKNRSFIDIIFADQQRYYDNSNLSVIRVVETLKENGLLDLFFNKPHTFEVTFSTNSSPLFFVKLMGDTLHAMGYYRYITKSSKLNSSEFTWSVGITSEYATDPILLDKELFKRGCKIVDIERISSDKWNYTIDVSYAHLNTRKIYDGEEVILRHSQQEHWLDVSNVKKVTLWSLKGNNWYPYISYYDRSLRLLKVYKRDKKSWQVTLRLPKDCVYIKISDMYSLKNIKDGIRLNAQGQK
jgi:hypothetical protein